MYRYQVNFEKVFTAAMVGRWLSVTDPATPGQGYWFRLTGFTSSSAMTLGGIDGTAVVWPFATATPASLS